MSDYLENKVVDWFFRGASFTPPATLFIALCTATPTDATTSATLAEVPGGNYVRQSVPAATTNFYSTQGDTSATSSGTNGTTSNVNTISWTSVTWSATVSAVAILDTYGLGQGNILFWGALSASKTVNSGDSVSLAGGGGAGSLSIQIDN